MRSVEELLFVILPPSKSHIVSSFTKSKAEIYPFWTIWVDKLENSKEDSVWERSSTSRPLNTAFTIPSFTHTLNLARDEEVDEACTQKRSFKSGIPTNLVPFGANGEISLREWLDRPSRLVDKLECLHIFRQVVEVVNLAHSQSVAVTNIRPSCFVMTAFNRVSFIESASSSGSEDSLGEPASVDLNVSGGFDGGAKKIEEKKNFPLKDILVMEFNWYNSPEEVEAGSCTFASDIYRLGVLLFELFCVFDSLDEKFRIMSNLRHRVLPPRLLLNWPKVASFCLWLLHPQPESRPKISEVLQSEFFNETRDGFEEHEAAIKLKEEIEEKELVLEFLLPLQERKQEAADKLHDTISFLSDDIEVANQKLKGYSNSELNKDKHLAVECKNQLSLFPVVNEDPACTSSRKRFKTGHWNNIEHAIIEGQEKVLSKSSRLMKNLKNLEAAYFSSRARLMKSTSKLMTIPTINIGREASNTEGSAVGDLALRECDNGSKSEWIDPFLDGLCKYLSFSKLKVRGDLMQGDLLNPSNLICALAFDRDKDFFATAGVNRKIKIFECDTLLDNERDVHYPIVEMATRSKLSSICWNGYIKTQIASSDFEGVVQIWDVARSQAVAEMKEQERRVWSVDFSMADPTKLASGSDDGSVKLWNINQGGSIGSIGIKANVCSVQFAPDSCQLLAIGSADHSIYCYDLRNLRVPWCTLVGHEKTVSYVKFVDSRTLVSASTDNTLKLWDLSISSSRVIDNPLQTFTGHTNIKNFVGLSVSDGYIATGSETNEVFVYHKAFPMPVLSYTFSNTDPISGRESDEASQFVSCVCWRGQSNTLVAANSSGNIKILEMV